MNRFVNFLVLGLCFVGSVVLAKDKPRQELGLWARPEVQAFAQEMVQEHGFNDAQLRRWFSQTKPNEEVIRLMSLPIQKPPRWNEYAPFFLNPDRIDGGRAYLKQNAKTLARAESQYGVPQSVIAAIVGVETSYGKVTGRFKVFEALATLAFDYPRRAAYFRGELKNFLLLMRDKPGYSATTLGSYAGAMGWPQFMPTSVQKFAVDFDGDGRINLWDSPADIVGSVAAYFKEHGWVSGAPVWQALESASPAAQATIDGALSSKKTIAEWRDLGVQSVRLSSYDDATQAALLLLETDEGLRYYLVFENFFTIMRYNKSRLYASAVWSLAQAIAD